MYWKPLMKTEKMKSLDGIPVGKAELLYASTISCFLHLPFRHIPPYTHFLLNSLYLTYHFDKPKFCVKTS